MSYEREEQKFQRDQSLKNQSLKVSTITDGASSGEKASAKEGNRIASVYDCSYEARVVLKGRLDINVMDKIYLEVFCKDGSLHFSSGEYLVLERTDTIEGDFTTSLKLQKISGDVGSTGYVYDSNLVSSGVYSRNITKGYNVPKMKGTGSGEQIVNEALKYQGNPYLWGGNSLTNGIDCSHFVCKILSMYGWTGGYMYSGALRYAGERVERKDVRPGDVMCYNGHVAFYMDETHIVHARGKAYGIECTECNPYTYHGGYVDIRRLLEYTQKEQHISARFDEDAL